MNHEQGKADGVFINDSLVQWGYGQVMTVPPNVKYQEVFLKPAGSPRDESLEEMRHRR